MVMALVIGTLSSESWRKALYVFYVVRKAQLIASITVIFYFCKIIAQSVVFGLDELTVAC